ncbi:MAG: tetratricopeptide repeat protein [Candidatus Hermodarchaeota archaeon]
MIFIFSNTELLKQKIKGLRFQGKSTEAIQLINKVTKDRTLSEQDRIDLVIDKCSILTESGKHPAALLVINELITVIKEGNFPLSLLRANIVKAEVLRKSGQEKEGLTLLNETEELLNKHQEISYSERLKLKGEIHCYKGILHAQLGNNDSAIEQFQKSIEISKEDLSEESLARAYNGLGLTFLSQGNFNKSLKYLKKTLAIYQRLIYKPRISIAYNNIGFFYEGRGEYELAIECYQNALAIEKEFNNKLIIAVLKRNLGSAYIPLDKYQDALKYLKESLELIQEVHNDYHHSTSLVVIIDLLALADFENEDVKKYLEQLEKLYMNNKTNLTIKHRYTYAKAVVLKMSDRLIDKMQAQTIFKQIVEGKVIILADSVRAALNLAELLLMEFKTTKNVEILYELENLATRLLKTGKEQKNYLVQIKALLLKSKLELLNLQIIKAEEFLEQAKTICEEKGLNRLVMTIIEEQEVFINKRKLWNEMIKEEKSYQERLELTELDNTLTRMIKNKLEVIDEYDEIVESFTIDKIGFIVCKFSKMGVEVIASLNLPERSEFEKYETYMAVSFMTILGQGTQYHEGLFGPLPVPVEGYSSIVYSKIIKDSKQTNGRLKGKNFSLFCILYPQKFSMLFFNRNALVKIFDNRLEEIDDLAALKTDFLVSLRDAIYKKVTELIVPKDLATSLAL